MNRTKDHAGFTLIELLVVMALFSVISVGFYSVMFSGRRGATTSQNIARVSQEARLGFNRIVRDSREAAVLEAATATSYTVRVDFDGDGSYSAANFEIVTYAYSDPTDRITISNGTITETLISGVEQIGTTPVFSYSSNRLEYDANNDGITTVTELDTAQAAGAALTTDKTQYLSTISYAFRVRSGSSVGTFYTQAQLRNRR
jgi:prepilin-type N-terminal cleavage/methylation domain-containing protein